MYTRYYSWADFSFAHFFGFISHSQISQISQNTFFSTRFNKSKNAVSIPSNNRKNTTLAVEYTTT